mmetsp:Transcript_22672/g.33806  ORF Transcript_22672/g.33806 Transcript_22672/m.33806 type:complete len:541 (+) Transcript_22672:61-1683(+)
MSSKDGAEVKKSEENGDQSGSRIDDKDVQPKITYTREQLIDISKFPASNKKPEGFSTDFLRDFSETRNKPRKGWWEDRSRKWSEGDPKRDKYRMKSGKRERGEKGWRETRTNRRNGREGDKVKRNSQKKFERADSSHSSGAKENFDESEWNLEDEGDFEFGKNDLEADRARYKQQRSQAGQGRAQKAEGRKASGNAQSIKDSKALKSKEEPDDNNEDINNFFAKFSKMNVGTIDTSGTSKARSRFSFSLSKETKKSPALIPSQPASSEALVEPKSRAAKSRFGFILSEDVESGDNAKPEMSRAVKGEKGKVIERSTEGKLQRGHQPAEPVLPNLPVLPEMYPDEPKSVQAKSAKQLFLIQNRERKQKRDSTENSRTVENVHSEDYGLPSRPSENYSQHKPRKQEQIYSQQQSSYNQPMYSQMYHGRSDARTRRFQAEAHRVPAQQYFRAQQIQNHHPNHQMHYVNQQHRQMMQQQTPSNYHHQQHWEGRGGPANYGVNGRQGYDATQMNRSYQRDYQIQDYPKQGFDQPSFKKFFGHMLS